MKHLIHLSKANIAIIAISLILIIALVKDIDGALVGTGIAIIAGLGGYITGKRKAATKNGD